MQPERQLTATYEFSAADSRTFLSIQIIIPGVCFVAGSSNIILNPGVACLVSLTTLEIIGVAVGKGPTDLVLLVPVTRNYAGTTGSHVRSWG